MEIGNQFLGTERIDKLMRQYAVPCIISLLVGALYNIVDQIFIANASYLGSYGNAANTVVFPLTIVALAIAVMVGDGCCAFVSMALGRNETARAKRSVGNAVVLIIVGSLILTAVYLIFANSIIAMFGGTVNEETYRHSQEYFFYITLGIPFYMFGQAMNPIIRADGNPKFAMISTLAGAVINIILDPIFIFGLQWGMMGAAVATVIGQVVAVAKLTSRVLLICDATHALPIQVLRNDIRVIAAGNGCTDDLQLEHLPANTDIRVGDVLVTSGLGGRFPEGYPVAVVSSVKLDTQRAYTVIQARPTAGLQRLRYLLLLWGADRNGANPMTPEEVHRVANERLMQMMPQVLPSPDAMGPKLPEPATGIAQPTPQQPATGNAATAPAAPTQPAANRSPQRATPPQSGAQPPARAPGGQ